MQAYGQRHDTSDGKLCWLGRIKRADALLAKSPDDKTRKAVEKLVGLAQKDMEWAEQKRKAYLDLCGVAGIKPQTIESNCTCEYCQTIPAMHWDGAAEQPGLTGHEILAYLAPPLELMDCLEDRQAQLPKSVVGWMKRWQTIRGDGTSQIDRVKPEAWASINQIIKGEKVLA